MYKYPAFVKTYINEPINIYTNTLNINQLSWTTKRSLIILVKWLISLLLIIRNPKKNHNCLDLWTKLDPTLLITLLREQIFYNWIHLFSFHFFSQNIDREFDWFPIRI